MDDYQQLYDETDSSLEQLEWENNLPRYGGLYAVPQVEEPSWAAVDEKSSDAPAQGDVGTVGRSEIGSQGQGSDGVAEHCEQQLAGPATTVSLGQQSIDVLPTQNQDVVTDGFENFNDEPVYAAGVLEEYTAAPFASNFVFGEHDVQAPHTHLPSFTPALPYPHLHADADIIEDVTNHMPARAKRPRNSLDDSELEADRKRVRNKSDAPAAHADVHAISHRVSHDGANSQSPSYSNVADNHGGDAVLMSLSISSANFVFHTPSIPGPFGFGIFLIVAGKKSPVRQFIGKEVVYKILEFALGPICCASLVDPYGVCVLTMPFDFDALTLMALRRKNIAYWRNEKGVDAIDAGFFRRQYTSFHCLAVAQHYAHTAYCYHRMSQGLSPLVPALTELPPIPTDRPPVGTVGIAPVQPPSNGKGKGRETPYPAIPVVGNPTGLTNSQYPPPRLGHGYAPSRPSPLSFHSVIPADHQVAAPPPQFPSTNVFSGYSQQQQQPGIAPSNRYTSQGYATENQNQTQTYTPRHSHGNPTNTTTNISSQPSQAAGPSSASAASTPSSGGGIKLIWQEPYLGPGK